MNDSNPKLPNDPLTGLSIKQLGAKLRNGSITCV